MRKRNRALAMVSAVVLSVCFYFNPLPVGASPSVLKKGMRGDAVSKLQKDLKTLGYFNANITGYYGSITTASVKNLQKKNGLVQDGVVGKNTFSVINKLLNRAGTASSRGSSGSASSSVLKKGMRNSAVTQLQKDLIKLGYLSANATGYYGDLTVAAVKKLQKHQGLTQDGIAGKNTFAAIDRLLGRAKSSASRGQAVRNNFLMPWFDGVDKLFKIGKTATVYDIDSGLSFEVKRTYGYNHADCETLTAEDTKIMKKIYGGSWSWNRRAIIVTVDGTRIAASMAGMPHAGSDSYAANSYINSRSGGYGRGANLDAVKGNGMNGVFDIHFKGSKTHGTNRVNEAHQKMVNKAAEWAKKNY
jgi:peptidoglycan hydrolase-like protein with peptidoglycan-binding domain